jgi:hypothetical protein
MQYEKENYAIMDSKGIIYEGQPLQDLLRIMHSVDNGTHDFEYEGDLLLVQIMARTK